MGKMDMPTSDLIERDWAEFTEDGFRGLVQLLKAQRYTFASFLAPPEEPHVLWRHDVDMSLHRAARLAEIEREEGVVATYFLNPRSRFYNLLEPEASALTARISACGHTLGLHFDGEAYDVRHWTRQQLAEAIHHERTVMETTLGMAVRTMSWHNPDTSNVLDFGDLELGGLVNAYADRFRHGYAYGSDSNGYWRFAPMRNIILKGHPKLHLLTHPDWWAPVAMPPSERVDRCIQGRALATRQYYDALLKKSGRANVIS